MLEQIGLAVLTGLVIGPLSALITVWIALKQFKNERRWERRVQAHERLLEALHAIKKHNILWDNAFRSDKSAPDDSTLMDAEKQRTEALADLDRALALGEFVLPRKVIADVRAMTEDIQSLKITEQNFNEAYQQENEIVDKALAKIRTASY